MLFRSSNGDLRSHRRITHTQQVFKNMLFQAHDYSERDSNKEEGEKKEKKTKRCILFVATSAGFLSDGKTKAGLWLEELAIPYYYFKELGYDLTLASPKGGPVP